MDHDTEVSNAERIFARICRDEAYAEQISRGEFDTTELTDDELTDDERTALQHDAGLLVAETVGFTSSLMVDSMGISTSWVKPCPSHFHGSDFNAARSLDAHRPKP